MHIQNVILLFHTIRNSLNSSISCMHVWAVWVRKSISLHYRKMRADQWIKRGENTWSVSVYECMTQIKYFTFFLSFHSIHTLLSHFVRIFSVSRPPCCLWCFKSLLFLISLLFFSTPDVFSSFSSSCFSSISYVAIQMNVFFSGEEEEEEWEKNGE